MNRDMGIKVPGLVAANVSLQPEEAENIADNIRRQPMVESVARSTCNVIGEYWTRPLVSNSGERIGNLNWNSCTSDYTDVMGIKIIEGSPMKNPGDLLVNEEVVRLMKWSDGAVGKRLNNFLKQEPLSVCFVMCVTLPFFMNSRLLPYFVSKMRATPLTSA